MTARSVQLVEEASRMIFSARDELESAAPAVAARKASSAMLKLAQACLDVDGLSPTDASAVCVAYGEQFARTRRLYSAYHRWLLDATDLSRAASGQVAAPIDSGSAVTAVERAEIFRDAIERFLERKD
jgi:uncharacterized protein (UPF0332 family)